MQNRFSKLPSATLSSELCDDLTAVGGDGEAQRSSVKEPDEPLPGGPRSAQQLHQRG